MATINYPSSTMRSDHLLKGNATTAQHTNATHQRNNRATTAQHTNTTHQRNNRATTALNKNATPLDLCSKKLSNERKSNQNNSFIGACIVCYICLIYIYIYSRYICIYIYIGERQYLKASIMTDICAYVVTIYNYVQ